MKNKILFFLTIFLLIASAAFTQEIDQQPETASNELSVEETASEETISQTADEPMAEKNTQKKNQVFPLKFEKPGSFKGFLHQLHPTFSLSPTLVMNSDNTIITTPVSVIVPVTVGVFWENGLFISTEPNISITLRNYMWDDAAEKAYPADLENRTAFTLMLIPEIPAVFSINPTRNSHLRISAGIAFVLRFGFLSNGVKETDSGTSGNAKTDLEKINEWFMKEVMHFTASLAWMFGSPSKDSNLQFGPEIKLRMPFSPGTNGMMISAGMKIMI